MSADTCQMFWLEDGKHHSCSYRVDEHGPRCRCECGAEKYIRQAMGKEPLKRLELSKPYFRRRKKQ